MKTTSSAVGHRPPPSAGLRGARTSFFFMFQVPAFTTTLLPVLSSASQTNSAPLTSFYDHLSFRSTRLNLTSDRELHGISCPQLPAIPLTYERPFMFTRHQHLFRRSWVWQHMFRVTGIDDYKMNCTTLGPTVTWITYHPAGVSSDYIFSSSLLRKKKTRSGRVLTKTIPEISHIRGKWRWESERGTRDAYQPQMRLNWGSFHFHCSFATITWT